MHQHTDPALSVDDPVAAGYRPILFVTGRADPSAVMPVPVSDATLADMLKRAGPVNRGAQLLGAGESYRPFLFLAVTCTTEERGLSSRLYDIRRIRATSDEVLDYLALAEMFKYATYATLRFN